jgi:hypothetical protein
LKECNRKLREINRKEKPKEEVPFRLPSFKEAFGDY